MKIHLRLSSATTALGTLALLKNYNDAIYPSYDSPIPSATDRLASLLSTLRAIPASEVNLIADSFEKLFKEVIFATSSALPSTPAEVEPYVNRQGPCMAQLVSNFVHFVGYDKINGSILGPLKVMPVSTFPKKSTQYSSADVRQKVHVFVDLFGC